MSAQNFFRVLFPDKLKNDSYKSCRAHRDKTFSYLPFCFVPFQSKVMNFLRFTKIPVFLWKFFEIFFTFPYKAKNDPNKSCSTHRDKTFSYVPFCFASYESKVMIFLIWQNFPNLHRNIFGKFFRVLLNLKIDLSKSCSTSWDKTFFPRALFSTTYQSKVINFFKLPKVTDFRNFWLVGHKEKW